MITDDTDSWSGIATLEDIEEAMGWLSRAGDHEAGLHEPGGPGMQSHKVVQAAGVVANQRAYLMAKEFKARKDAAKKGESR